MCDGGRQYSGSPMLQLPLLWAQGRAVSIFQSAKCLWSHRCLRQLWFLREGSHRREMPSKPFKCGPVWCPDKIRSAATFSIPSFVFSTCRSVSEPSWQRNFNSLQRNSANDENSTAAAISISVSIVSRAGNRRQSVCVGNPGSSRCRRRTASRSNLHADRKGIALLARGCKNHCRFLVHASVSCASDVPGQIRDG